MPQPRNPIDGLSMEPHREFNKGRIYLFIVVKTLCSPDLVLYSPEIFFILILLEESIQDRYKMCLLTQWLFLIRIRDIFLDILNINICGCQPSVWIEKVSTKERLLNKTLRIFNFTLRWMYSRNSFHTMFSHTRTKVHNSID